MLDAEPEGRASGEAAVVGPLLQSVQDLDPQQVQEQEQQQRRTCQDETDNQRSHHSDTAGGSAEQLSLGLDPAESSAAKLKATALAVTMTTKPLQLSATHSVTRDLFLPPQS